MTHIWRNVRLSLFDLLLGCTLGALEMCGIVALLLHTSHDQLETSWRNIVTFGAWAGAAGTLTVFLNRVVVLATGKIKEELRRRITTRHARKS